MPVFAKRPLSQQQSAVLFRYSLYSAPSQNSLETQGVYRKHVICVNNPDSGLVKQLTVHSHALTAYQHRED